MLPTSLLCVTTNCHVWSCAGQFVLALDTCWSSFASTLAWPNPACWGSPGAGWCRAEWPRPAQPVFVSLQVSGSLTELGVRVVAGPPGWAGGPTLWPARAGADRPVLVAHQDWLAGRRRGPPGQGLVGQRMVHQDRGWWPVC